MLQQGRLSIDYNLATAQDEFRMNIDSAREFVHAEADLDPDVQVDQADQADLYRAYKKWCTEQYLTPVTSRRFYASVLEVGGITRFRSNGRRRLAGIGLVPEPPPPPEP